MKACFNGRWAHPSDFSVSPFSPDFQFGTCVFETLRTYDGRCFEVEAHLDRLASSAKILVLDLRKVVLEAGNEKCETASHAIESLRSGTFQQKLRTWIGQAEDQMKRGVEYRVKIFLNQEFVWISVLGLENFEQENYSKGVEIIDVIHERNFPEAKYANPAYHFFRSIQPAHVFETIFFSPDGFLREGNISNVFVFLDNQLMTPDKGILKGVTRQRVIQVAQELGIEVVEGHISKEKMRQAKEIMITCTSKEVIPVRKWGGWENHDFSIAQKLRKEGWKRESIIN